MMKNVQTANELTVSDILAFLPTETYINIYAPVAVVDGVSAVSDCDECQIYGDTVGVLMYYDFRVQVGDIVLSLTNHIVKDVSPDLHHVDITLSGRCREAITSEKDRR